MSFSESDARISPTREKFRGSWTPGKSLVMLRRILSDGPTPRELFRSLPSGEGNVLLESQNGPYEFARYCILASEPDIVFRYQAGRWRLAGEGEVEGEGNPFPVIQQIVDRRAVASEEGIPFTGGAVGYFGYDLVHLFEDVGGDNPDPLNIPHMVLFFYDRFYLRDRKTGEWIAGVRVACEGDAETAYDRGLSDLESLAARLRGPFPPRRQCDADPASVRFLGDEATYADRAGRILRHITEGDVYQVNYSQRCEIQCPDLDPWEVFESVSQINPAPFAAYLDMGGFQVISNSPERLVVVVGRQIYDRPLAGTIRRLPDMPDSERFQALVSDPKEAAEHRMLVDLERNDLGRICEYGSIRVTDLMIPEICSHLIHICSNMTGTLRRDAGLFEIFRAVFPGGTITGVPKVRCMEILEQLEDLKRSIFYGSIGYLSYDGQVQLSILIRTLLAKQNRLYFQVGGGVVADSKPEREYRESRLKAEAMLEAATGRTRETP